MVRLRAVLAQCAQKKTTQRLHNVYLYGCCSSLVYGCQSLGAAASTSSVRMVFIHSAAMASRSVIDMPA